MLACCALCPALLDYPDSTALETPICTCEEPNRVSPDEADAGLSPYTVGCVTPRSGGAIAVIGETASSVVLRLKRREIGRAHV